MTTTKFLNLQGVLNALNGDAPSRYGQAEAACKYAGFPPPYTQLSDWVAALNYKNGTHPSQKAGAYMEKNAICAKLAGVSNTNSALFSLNQLAGTL